MAINLTTDLNVTTGGKLTDIGQIQGGWKTVATESDMNALTASAVLKGKLQNGQMFYVSSSATLYSCKVVGSGPFAVYSFNQFTWPGAETTELNTFTSSIQAQVSSLTLLTGSYATTGSNLFIGDQTINGVLTLTTQSSTPVVTTGGLYIDSNYDLFYGSST